MSALPLSTAKVSGSSALKTQLESTLKVDDAGLEFTIQGGATYKWNGTSFDTISTSGASHTETQSGSVNAYGPHPATYWTDTSATGAAAGTVYTLTDASMYNQHLFHLSALTATSMDVYSSVDGTNYVGPLMLTDVKTNANFATAAVTAVGMYKLLGKFHSIRVDQVGVNALTVKVGHGWV